MICSSQSDSRNSPPLFRYSFFRACSIGRAMFWFSACGGRGGGGGGGGRSEPGAVASSRGPRDVPPPLSSPPSPPGRCPCGCTWRWSPTGHPRPAPRPRSRAVRPPAPPRPLLGLGEVSEETVWGSPGTGMPSASRVRRCKGRRAGPIRPGGCPVDCRGRALRSPSLRLLLLSGVLPFGLWLPAPFQTKFSREEAGAGDTAVTTDPPPPGEGGGGDTAATGPGPPQPPTRRRGREGGRAGGPGCWPR